MNNNIYNVNKENQKVQNNGPEETNKFYYEIIIKGAIWVFMFSISLLGLILVFKDNSNKEELIIVSSKNPPSYIQSNNASNLNSLEDSMMEEDKDFLNKYEKDKNQTSDITKKQTLKSTPTIKKEKLLTEENNTSIINNETNNKTIAHESKQDLNNLIQNVTNNNEKTPEKTQKSDTTSSANANKVETSKPLNKSVVWLVSIYSGTNLEKTKAKWNEIYAQNPSLFANKKVYFIKTNIPEKGIFYRICLGDTNSITPSFANPKDALNYCKYLKSNNISCFTTEVDKNNLN